MNRTIKFRGKCLHSDEWCFGSLVDYKDEEMEIQGFDVFRGGFDTWSEISVDSDTVGQFTGLLDANGKEIYEGDIVKFHFMKSDPCTAKLFPTAKFFGEITTNKYNQWAIFSDGMEIHIENATEHGEVVGNIHDNPELLKGGKNGQTAEQRTKSDY